MAQREIAAVKVGAFVLAALIVGVGGVVALGAGVFAPDKTRLETYFTESVHGLSVGSPVKFRGVKIGVVDSITLGRIKYGIDFEDPDSVRWGAYVVVVAAVNPSWITRERGLSLSEHVSNRVEEGLRVQLALKGISGLLYLEVDYLPDAPIATERPPWRSEFPYVPAMESRITQWSASLTRFLQKVDELDVGQIAQHLDDVLTGIDESVRSLDTAGLEDRARLFLDELNLAAQDLRAVFATIEDDGVLENLQSTAQNLETSSARIGEILNGDEVNGSLTDIARASQNLGDASESMPALVQSAARSLDRIEVMLARQHDDLGLLVENLRVASDNLRRLSAAAATHPSGVLFGDPPPPARPDSR